MTTNFILQSSVKFPVGVWIESPPFTYQGCRPVSAFNVFLYTEDDTPHTVHLYAQGSQSIPWQTPQNKWSHLNPQWRFTDVDGNVVNELLLTNATPVTAFGTSGYMSSGQFYYIDDMPTRVCETILLWVVADYFNYTVQKDVDNSTGNVPGYSNSKVIAVAPWYVNQLVPQRFEVLRDGINPVFDYYWINSVIPHTVVVMGDSGDGQSAIIKNCPPTNILGVSGDNIVRSIDMLPVSALQWTPDNNTALLSATDHQYFTIGGYLRSSVVSQITATDAIISASGNVYYENIPIHYPYLWVSNPENNTLNKIFAPCIPEEWITEDIPYSLELSQDIYDISSLQVTATPSVMSLTGFGGIYGIAMDEFKNIWCADAESDRVYKFDSNGVLISSINFGEDNDFGWVSGGCTPAGISVDSSNNVWLTFFDSTSAIYIDGTGGNILAEIQPNDVSIGTSVDPLYKPVLAEPDMNDDVWVTYHNTLCSCLVKYDNTGALITSITLPTCSNPMDIHIDRDNGLWVSLTYHAGPPYEQGDLYHYDEDGNLIESIAAVNPGYIALDSSDSVWFTQDSNTVTRYTTAGDYTHWMVGEPSNIDRTCALEGICCDISDRIYVINSIDNFVYPIINSALKPGIKIMPDNNLAWYNDIGSQYTEQNDLNKSIQAFGDWSGNKWLRKYNTLSDKYLSATITGQSSAFNIYDFTGYNIRRFNESWDAIGGIKSNIRQEHILNNTVYWDQYQDALWSNDGTVQGKAFGRESYEKIANFVANHSDVNTCNVTQLYSLAQYTDVPIDVFGINFPPELRRIMDIASINQQLLWGERCKCSENITNDYMLYQSSSGIKAANFLCDKCNHYHPGNRGELFDPVSYMVSAYTPFIIEDRSKDKDKYQIIYPPASCQYISAGNLLGDECIYRETSSICITTYPLSSFYHIILPQVFDFSLTANLDEFQQAITYFCFYEYIPITCNTQTAGIINWDDPYTTIQENVSSIEDWYSNGQILERILNYTLYKGLGLTDIADA